VKALDVAMARDAAVINLSLAGPPDELLARYVGLATGQNRVVVAAAGNGGPNAKPGFPAALRGVLAVTAVDAEDGRYELANVGTYIDVAAPGVDIIAPAPDGGYPPLSGTSMAAAHVSGIAALLRELMPMMSAAEVVAVLKTNTSDLGDAGRDSHFGAGLIDACAAAEQVSAAAVVCPAALQRAPDQARSMLPAMLGDLPREAQPGELDDDTGLDTGASDELVIELD
jgi:subtilisin family serine protease